MRAPQQGVLAAMHRPANAVGPYQAGRSALRVF